MSACGHWLKQVTALDFSILNLLNIWLQFVAGQTQSECHFKVILNNNSPHLLTNKYMSNSFLISLLKGKKSKLLVVFREEGLSAYSVLCSR